MVSHQSDIMYKIMPALRRFSSGLENNRKVCLYSCKYCFNTYNEVFKDSARSFKSLRQMFLLRVGAERVLRRCRHPGPRLRRVLVRVPAGRRKGCGRAGQTQEILTVFSLVLSFLPKV